MKVEKHRGNYIYSLRLIPKKGKPKIIAKCIHCHKRIKLEKHGMSYFTPSGIFKVNTNPKNGRPWRWVEVIPCRNEECQTLLNLVKVDRHGP